MFSNTLTRYGSVARFLHWSIATLILVGLVLGVVGKFTPRTAENVDFLRTLYSTHKTLGLTVLALAVMRVVWAIIQPRPVPIHPERKWETLAAEMAHWILYVALFALPLSGWVMHAAEDGFAPIWWPFGQDLPFVPKSDLVAERAASVHAGAAILLAVTLAAHIGGAFKHALIDRDGTLARMCFGTEAGAPSAAVRHATAVVGAGLVWVGVVGAALVLAQPHAQAGSVAVDAPASGWQVQAVEVSFTVEQFGSDVTGQIGTVSPQITYDPDTGDGQVRVDIDTGSVALGSITDQVKGVEFFDVAQFPNGVFEAAISRSEGAAHVAVGTLTLVGQTQEVTLPFTLTPEGDGLRMVGSVTLDRRDFGMGAAYPDQSTVGFDVDVAISLLANPPL